ncbi:MAG: hypothetical protein HYX99_03595, partial [Chloroflexi bacterium]|nr:hypothetical protein [Chloroflexota bacterium]
MAGTHGYAGKILRVDLSSRKLTDIPTSYYAERFVGGRGLAGKIYWDEVPAQASAFDPENRLIIVTGPLGGFPGLSGSLCQVHAKSPCTTPETFSYGHSAGFWGARLKLAGYDAVVASGKSERPVYLFMRDGQVELRDASHLWGRGTIQVRQMLKAELGSQVNVLAVGPAGENLVTFANIVGEGDSSVGGGMGAVMGSKGLKAIVVWGNKRPTAARPEELRGLVEQIRQMDRGRETWLSGHPHIKGLKEKPYRCWGCISYCIRNIAETSDGVKSKRLCHSGDFYGSDVLRYYGEYTEVALQAGRLCNDYGLETMSLDRMTKWMAACHREGKLTEEDIDIPLSKRGSLEYMETLVRKTALREGFGDILAGGPARCAEYAGSGTDDFVGGIVYGRGRPLRADPRVYLSSAIPWAMEPREANMQHSGIHDVLRRWNHWLLKMLPPPDGFTEGAPHPVFPGMALQDATALQKAIDKTYLSTKALREIARRFWGGELAVDFSTYEGKALAAKKVVDRAYAIESMILCRLKWPLSHVPYSEDHVGDPALEARVLSAVTGKDIDEEEFLAIGERAFNLARASWARDGRAGREHDRVPEFCFTTPVHAQTSNPDCLVPGRNGMLISLKGNMLDRQKTEKMMDEYYQLRGWDVATGLQTKEQLK